MLNFLDRITDRTAATNDFVKRIDRLEAQKMDLVLQGAEFKPELQAKWEILERKLQKYYRWYARAWLSGRV